MQKLEVFAVYDSAIGAFGPPFFQRSKAEAVRTFSDTCADPQNLLHKHAANFTLFHLGSYLDKDGSFSTLTAPEKVISAQECLRSVQSVSDSDRKAS